MTTALVPLVRVECRLGDMRPKVTPTYIPTYALAAPVLAGNATIAEMAWWFGCSEAEVEAAVRWEERNA